MALCLEAAETMGATTSHTQNKSEMWNHVGGKVHSGLNQNTAVVGKEEG